MDNVQLCSTNFNRKKITPCPFVRHVLSRQHHRHHPMFSMIKQEILPFELYLVYQMIRH